MTNPPLLTLPLTFRRSVVIALLFLLGACAEFSAFTTDAQLRVEKLLDEEEYSQALAIISRIDSSNPNYDALQEQRKTILIRMKSFEKNKLRETKRLQKQNRWAEAIGGIDAALVKIPTSEALLKQRELLLSGRTRYIQRKSLQLAEILAQNIPNTRALLDKIHSANPQQTQASDQREVVEQQARFAREVLIAATKEDIKRGSWTHAHSTIKYANALMKDDESLALQKKVERALKSRERKSYKKQQQSQVKLKTEKLKQLNLALANQQLADAQIIANDLLPWKDDEDVTPILNNLDRQISATVLRLTQEGQTNYTKGLLDLAIEQWQQALTLSPDQSELQTRLRRAQIFRDNYEKLQEIDDN